MNMAANAAGAKGAKMAANAAGAKGAKNDTEKKVRL